MAETPAQTSARLNREQGGRRPSTISGSRAGESFASDEDKEKGKARDKWLQAKGWSGLGAAARRPADWESQFEKHWKKLQATRAGQAKALAPKPTPSPTPE